MKRSPSRELLLLSLPLAFIAIAGVVLTRYQRHRPQEIDLNFQVVKPTMLEAFNGANAALMLTAITPPEKRLSLFNTKASLQVNHQGKILRTVYGGTQKMLPDVWKNGNVGFNYQRFSIDETAIPSGPLEFKSEVSFSNSSTFPAIIARVTKQWNVDRSQIAPIDLSKLPRSPLIEVESVSISFVNVTEVSGEVVFHQKGAEMDKETPLDITMRAQEKGVNLSWGSIGYRTKDDANTKARNWMIYLSPQTPNRVTLFGRASADYHWPLDFEIELYDLKKAKSGMKLNFKSFPAPLPTFTKRGQ